MSDSRDRHQLVIDQSAWAVAERGRVSRVMLPGTVAVTESWSRCAAIPRTTACSGSANGCAPLVYPGSLRQSCPPRRCDAPSHRSTRRCRSRRTQTLRWGARRGGRFSWRQSTARGSLSDASPTTGWLPGGARPAILAATSRRPGVRPRGRCRPVEPSSQSVTFRGRRPGRPGSRGARALVGQHCRRTKVAFVLGTVNDFISSSGTRRHRREDVGRAGERHAEL